VRLRLSAHATRVVLEVTDDGSGFDVRVPAAGGPAPGRGAALPGTATGFGLSGMRERAELLGGRLELISAPGRGTTVRLVVPLSPDP
jgi:signal transduction histidine kinase